MKKNNIFIAIEGVDGVGKTTIASLLSTRLNATYQKTPLLLFKWIARLLAKLRSPEIETVGYYLLTVLTSLTISLSLRKKSVICDKYILNTLTSQSCLGGKLTKLITKIRYLFIKKPNYTFCLMVYDKHQLLKRLKERGKLDENDKQLLPHWTNIQAEYRNFNEVIIVDTTNRNPKEILKTIINYLNV